MNRSNKGANTNIIQIMMDILVLLVVFIIDRMAFDGIILRETYPKCFALVVIFGVVYILSNKEARIYNVTLFFYVDRFWRILSKSWLMAAAVTTGIMYIYNPDANIRKFHIFYLVLSYVALCINLVLSRLLQISMIRYQAPRVAFVGTFEEYEKFHYFLNKTSVKVEEVGYILNGPMPQNKVFNVLGTLDDLENVIRRYELDQVYFIIHSHDTTGSIQEYIDLCLEMGVTVKVVMDVAYGRSVNRPDSFVSSVGTYPLITYHTLALNTYEQFIKRLLDLVLSVIILIICSPIMVARGIALWLSPSAKVFDLEKRVGQSGRCFNLIKFGGGKKIDNLPEFINVVKGDMSLVGTRPPTVEEVKLYERSQWRRISIKPGITGLWRLDGKEQKADFEEIVEQDLRYIDSWTLLSDLKIIIFTMFKVIGNTRVLF